MAKLPPKSPSPAPAAASPAVPQANTPAKPPMQKPNVMKPTPASAHVAKTFSVTPWAGKNEGKKVTIYGKSGSGKTSLAALIENAIFIGIDDGGRTIKQADGTDLMVIPGIESYQDVRDALRQKNLFPDGSTAVIDTMTKLEELQEPYIFQHNTLKGGAKATSMRAFGWDGPSLQLDCLRLILTDLEGLVRRGINVVLLCQLAQIRVANAEGLDYLEDGPKLLHNNQYSSRTELCEWSDHVFRIGYTDMNVQKENEKAKVGKVVSSDATRAVFTGGAQHFIAKSRPVDGYRIPSVIGFESAQDDSLWQFMFKGARAE